MAENEIRREKVGCKGETKAKINAGLSPLVL